STTPPSTVALGHDYLFAVQTTFPAGDPLTYHLVTAPAGMTIDAGGVVHWTPTAAQFGSNPVTIRVDDGTRGSTQKTFLVNVVSQPTGQQSPVISSTPPGAATVGKQSAYNVAGNDPDGTPLIWSLDSAPAGMSLGQGGGTIRWTPTADQVGTQTVVV